MIFLDAATGLAALVDAPIPSTVGTTAGLLITGNVMVDRRAMTGTFIGPVSMRGKGYGTEAKELVLDYAFGELGMNSLWAITLESNEASRRALEKQGYVRGGVMRRAYLVKGQWEDALYQHSVSQLLCVE